MAQEANAKVLEVNQVLSTLPHVDCFDEILSSLAEHTEQLGLLTSRMDAMALPGVAPCSPGPQIRSEVLAAADSTNNSVK